MKILIAVTHLLGTGHLSRALTLARAFVDAGHHAVVMSGGFPAPHLKTADVQVIQLPALRSDGVNFTRLLTPAGTVASDEELSLRKNAAVDHLRSFEPDMFITELYPFGRRVLTSEFLALLDATQAMRPRPIVLSSVRDILAPPSKMSKAARADEVLAAYYDAVLVHSDPTATRLETSWPVSEALEAQLRYTGYVAPRAPEPHPDRSGEGEIIVSAGGSHVGDHIFECAARAACAALDQTWRLLVSGADADTRIARLRAIGTPAIIEPARPDFRQLLRHARASISMCGYNTAMDILQTGVPSVLIPFDAGNEVEQTLRASSLSALPGIEVLKSAELTADTLIQKVQSALHAPSRDTNALQFDGARKSVRIAENMVAQR